MSFFDALGNALGTMASQLQAEQDKINIYVGDYEHLSSYELKKICTRLEERNKSYLCSQEDMYRLKAVRQILRQRSNN